MTYWMLNLPFLAVAGVVGVAALLARRSPSWRGIGLAAIVVLILTAVFDNALVATGIVGYDPALISGAKIGLAPLEDFAYAIAGLVLLPSLWSLLTPRALPNRTSAPRHPGALVELGSDELDGGAE
jgi:lycopene cyclase domain-containing protein